MVSRPTPHVPNGFYHVTHRGNRKEAIFRSDADRRLIERLVRDSVQRYATEVHAYCWMPNHIHMLVRIRTAPVHRFVQHFASRYALCFNKTHDTVGHLFQGKHWAGFIHNDAYLHSTLRYIHRNPVAAKLTRCSRDFPWSSHRAYVGMRAPDWLTTSWMLDAFGQGRELEAFVEDVDAPTAADLPGVAREAESRFNLRPGDLFSGTRLPAVRRAKAWICQRAIRDLGLPVIEIADFLHCTPQTLVKGMSEWPEALLEGTSAAPETWPKSVQE